MKTYEYSKTIPVEDIITLDGGRHTYTIDPSTGRVGIKRTIGRVEIEQLAEARYKMRVYMIDIAYHNGSQAKISGTAKLITTAETRTDSEATSDRLFKMIWGERLEAARKPA